MALEDFVVSVTNLHTISTPYKGENYFKPLPNYPESIAKNEDESNDALTSRWTDVLQDDYNTKPHHPNSDMYYRASYRGKIEEDWDGNVRGFLNDKNPDNWHSMEDFISTNNLDENRWFANRQPSNVTGATTAGLARLRDWDISTYDFLRGMVKNKVEGADTVESKHYVGKSGERSRIFDLVNGYYGVAVDDSSAYSQLNAFLMKFLQKLNTEPDYLYQREHDPRTGKKILPNQEQLTYNFEHPNAIYHNKLIYRLLVETETPLEVEIPFDLDLTIQYFMALEKIQHGDIRNNAMKAIHGHFRLEPYKSALEERNLNPAQLSAIIQSPETKQLFEEVDGWSDEDLQRFVDENKTNVQVELVFEKQERYIDFTITIADLLNSIEDTVPKKALAASRPPKTRKDKGGKYVAKLLENITLGKTWYIIKITNDPMEVLLSNTSQEWGLRMGELWYNENKLAGYVSCINYNGVFACGPFFDFYNGNGVAYVAEVSEEAMKNYIGNIEGGVENEISPEELFYSTDCNIVGRISLRWGEKRDVKGAKIGWGIGIETTAYPKNQTWAEGAYMSIARIFKVVRDAKGNSIWDGGRNDEGRALNTIKAPYKMGWAYLDYNETGYSGNLLPYDYDCDGIERHEKELIPNYNGGWKFNTKGSRYAGAVELGEGIERNYDDFVTFAPRGFQEISNTLIPDINSYGYLQPSIYTTVAQNPQIWISPSSFSIIINNMFQNTIQEINHPIRKAFLNLALDSSSKNISWLLQPPQETLSIRENLNKYDPSEQWDMNPNGNLIQTLFNHPSVLEPFLGHEPSISIQEHLYNQNFIIRDRVDGAELGNASDFYLLQLNKNITSNTIVAMDNAVLSAIIKKLRKSIKQNLKTSELPTFIYPQIDLNWKYWTEINRSSVQVGADKKLLLMYYQMIALNNLAYNPALTEENYNRLCEMAKDIAQMNWEGASHRQQKPLIRTYNRLYQALTFSLLYNKSNIRSPLYTDTSVTTTHMNPELPEISRVVGWASELFENSGEILKRVAHEMGPPRDFGSMRRTNPYAQMNASTIQTISTTLQNTNTIRAWNSVPAHPIHFTVHIHEAIKKITMFYYLYHFSNSVRTHRLLLKEYDIYIQDLIKKDYLDDSYSAYAMLFDTTIGKDGKLLPSNPYINNEGVKLIRSRFSETDLSLLRSNLTLDTTIEEGLGTQVRQQFNDEGLTEFIRLLLDSDLATYGIGNMLALLRTPFQFRMAEQFIFQASLGEYFTTTRGGDFVFRVPEILNSDIDALIAEDKLEAYMESQNIIVDIDAKLSYLSNYLTYLSKNPYITPSIQSRLILSTTQTNAFSFRCKVVGITADGRRGNVNYANLHYSDIFALYKSNIYNQSKFGAIIPNLVKNPILAHSTIKQILTKIDDSLLKDFMLNSKFHFEDDDLADLSSQTNKILFDYGPTILTENLGISDNLRLTLFNNYLEGLFEIPEKDYNDSLPSLKDFVFNVDNLRSDSNFTQFKNTLAGLNFDNIGYWRGGFGKFGLNKYIPSIIERQGDAISEQVIGVNKPQIIVDINFKPPHSDAYTTGSPYGFLTENEWIELIGAGEEVARLKGAIAIALDELGFESLEEAQEMVENGEEVNMVELGELEENYDLLSQASRGVSEWKAANKQKRDASPIDITIRYINEREITQRGVKLSGSYWDSSRVRVTNKWSKTYPDWDSVYGYGTYGQRKQRDEEDGGHKFWQNQITLVFSDTNPHIGWDAMAETGKILPKWRMDDEVCSRKGFREIVASMVTNMKDPQTNLEPFLTNYAGFIQGSRHFNYVSRNNSIMSENIILLNERKWNIGVAELSVVIDTIDMRDLWDCISYEGSNHDLYTTNPIIFTLFMDSLHKGTFLNLRRPSLVLLLPLCQNLTSEEEYLGCLSENFAFLELDVRGRLKIDLGGLGIHRVKRLIDLDISLSYPEFINTAYNLVKGLDGKIEGVVDDIQIFAILFDATRNLENSRLHEVCRNVLVERGPDWVEFMRAQGEGNPDAVVQDAEEFYNASNIKVNKHKEKMKKYIKQILRGGIDA